MSSTARELEDKTVGAIEFYQQGRYQEAEAGFLDSLKMSRALGDSPTELIESLSNLSIVYVVLSKLPEALTCLTEALTLFPFEAGSAHWRTLRACILNNQARILHEMEQVKEAEEKLLEAIELIEAEHPIYAAHFHANLIRMIAFIPRWRDKLKHHADEFDRLQARSEELEIYLDSVNGWWRPGRYWDIPGQASAESIKALSINYHTKHLYESNTDAKSDYQLILDIDENTKQVSPLMVAHVYQALAEISVQTGDFQAATRYCEDCLRVISSSYLSTHLGSVDMLIKVLSFLLIGGKVEQSKQCLAKAKSIVSEAVSADSPRYAWCLTAESLLLPFLSGGGKDLYAEQLGGLRKSRDVMMRYYPNTHSGVLDLNIFIVKALIEVNQLDEAENLLNETMRDAQNNQIDAIAKQRSCLSSLADLRIKQSRTAEVEGVLKMSESLLEQHKGQPPELRLRELDHIAKQYMDAGLTTDGERAYRECVNLASSMSAKYQQNAKQHLALCLMRLGKAADAGDVLGNIGETGAANSQGGNRRDELVAQSHLAWSLQTKRRYVQAKALATEVVNEAHLLMPECEESLVIALSVLMEQAKLEDQPDEMVRLISMLSGYDTSIRLRVTMPVLYLEAAQLYAKQKSLKADALFEKALKAAEDVHAMVPHCLDGCVLAYMNFCTANRKNDLALQLCERLIALRTVSRGTRSLEYAVAITAKARLLADSNPTTGDALTFEALNILESMTDPTTRIQLLVTVSVREGILKKLLKFEESEKMAARSLELRAELDAAIAALKAGRELQK